MSDTPPAVPGELIEKAREALVTHSTWTNWDTFTLTQAPTAECECGAKFPTNNDAAQHQAETVLAAVYGDIVEAARRDDPIASAARTIRETGGAVEIAGVRIEPCDEYGATETTRERDAALAEVERLTRTEERRGMLARGLAPRQQAERDRAVEAARRDALREVRDVVCLWQDAATVPDYYQACGDVLDLLVDLAPTPPAATPDLRSRPVTPYWTGSTPKRRTAPVSEGPSGALAATESVEGAVPGIPGSPEGAQGHSGPSEGRARMARRRVRRHAQAAERADLAPAPVRDAEGPQIAAESVEWGVRFVSGDGAVTTGYTDEADAKKSAAYWEHRGDPGTVMRRTVTVSAWEASQ